MNPAQLKQLAAEIRPLFDGLDLAVSHGKALDLIAALPGLRNWPEVVAFADRIDRLPCDMAAMTRLSRRLLSTLTPPISPFVARRFDAEHLMNRLAPWLLDEPAHDPARRDRLVIVTSDSARGSMRRAAIAARVEKTCVEVVLGPVPTHVEPPDFVAARLAAWDAEPQTTDQPEVFEREPVPPGDPSSDWTSQPDLVAEFERIELWPDPEPNAQLLLMQMLDWFGRRPALLERLFIVHPELAIGGQTPYSLRQASPRIDKVDNDSVELAIRAWKAFGEPTPEPWFELLASDLTALPLLRRTVGLLLGELPAPGSGLGDTQRRLLEAVASGNVKPLDVMVANGTRSPGHVFGYWHVGRLLDQLGRSPCPAIDSLDEGPFDLAMHDDRARMQRWRDSRLSLSDFGRALLAGQDDLARCVPIRHWWGGTLLSNERLWRWDARTQSLITPT